MFANLFAKTKKSLPNDWIEVYFVFVMSGSSTDLLDHSIQQKHYWKKKEKKSHTQCVGFGHAGG